MAKPACSSPSDDWAPNFSGDLLRQRSTTRGLSDDWALSFFDGASFLLRQLKWLGITDLLRQR
ncbi:hypothetical protein M6B38_208105 [Iris pallida]|uniref:Uncharacterized protein n=1 Tax=Iris pallida TaxID=29817 RepID=A0AAX6E5C3_IRIPA|nr:hypothetical protein M6B38_208105 [Iris pallida]